MDAVVVKAFINLLGIYPVGTLVVLDTFELAIVHAANMGAQIINISSGAATSAPPTGTSPTTSSGCSRA